MAKNNVRHKRKGQFALIPFSISKTEPYARLPGNQVKLLVDLLTQGNGKNNGSLSPCHSLLKQRGWAKSSLYRAFQGLEHAGFVVITRQGSKIRGDATLVAITWNGIDPPVGKRYDEEVRPNPVPLNYWCKSKSVWKHQPKLKPPG